MLNSVFAGQKCPIGQGNALFTDVVLAMQYVPAGHAPQPSVRDIAPDLSPYVPGGHNMSVFGASNGLK